MKCVYCGKEYTEGGSKISVSNGTFDVCSNECKKQVRDYLEKDMQYKNRSYIMIFCGSIGFILSTFVFSGTYKLVPMYLGMIIAGIALVLYPYIFQSFITFTRYPIRKADTAVRIVGGLIIVISLAFLAMTFGGHS
jgi:putative flippase GtrA